MLGYAIRICDERGDAFYKNSFNLLNNFIVGEILSEARVFLDKPHVEKKLEILNKFLDNQFQSGTIRDFICRNNQQFTGFEIVEVEFDELYFTLLLKCEDNRFTNVKSVEYDEHGSPQVKLSVESTACQQFSSKRLAEIEILKLEDSGFYLANRLVIKPTFTNIRVFE